jgi:hypothetical protein
MWRGGAAIFAARLLFSRRGEGCEQYQPVRCVGDSLRTEAEQCALNDLETAFFYIAIGLAILLPFSLLKFALRERYARVLIKRQSQGVDKLLRYTPLLAWNLRMLTWMSLLCLAVVPVALYYYLEVNLSITFALFALMFTTVFVEYRFQKWLYQFLTNLES